MANVRKRDLNLTDNAIRVLKKRYLFKDETGKVVETPFEMFERVAKCVAAPDLRYDPDCDVEAVETEFFNLMTSLEFMPNSPTLMNAGRPNGQLSACFVLPIEDTMEGIFNTIKHAALIHKTGGGTGFSFSKLRPANDVVRSTGGIASGPVSFLRVFNAATEAIKQGGTRRGANMGMLRVDHPDVLEFISCKDDIKEITNFNISVLLDERFMAAVEKNEDYDLINPRTGQKVKSLSARMVWNTIIEHAWRTGEPGIVFIDRVNKDNPTPLVGEIEATNPCAEQPLLAYEACNLGSMNLGKCVKNGEIDWGTIRRVVRSSIHFLDNVIDANFYPLPEIDQIVRANRKIGLGVMGWADMLIELGIPYNSDEAVELAGKLIMFIRETADEMSEELGEKRGAFPNFKGSIYDKPGACPLRNSTRITIAPTGTICIIAGCSGGIEPLFAVSFIKNVMDRDELYEVNSAFERIARKEGWYSEELMRTVARHGSIQNIPGIPERWKRVFVVSHDITPEGHVKMLAAWQRHTDNAVSKTVNFRHEATVDEVREVYWLAYKLGCKSVAMYRDGSRSSQVLNIGKVNREEEKDKQDAETSPNQMKAADAKGETVNFNGTEMTEEDDIDAAAERLIPMESESEAPPRKRIVMVPGKYDIVPRPRPEVVTGETQRIDTGCGKMYVTINEDEDSNPFEVFSQIGKAGGCIGALTEAITRLISLALRSGVEVKSVLKQIRGISCPKPIWVGGGDKISSCPDAICRSIEKYLERKGQSVYKFPTNNPAPIPTETREEELLESLEGFAVDEAKGKGFMTKDGKNGNGSRLDNPYFVDICPDCGGTLEPDSGCFLCRICGYSQCG